jgi:hypothetical protein
LAIYHNDVIKISYQKGDKNMEQKKSFLDYFLQNNLKESKPIFGLEIFHFFNMYLDEEMYQKTKLFYDIFINDRVINEYKFYRLKELEAGVIYPVLSYLKLDKIALENPKEFYPHIEDLYNSFPIIEGEELYKVKNVVKNLPKGDFDCLSIRILFKDIGEKIDPSIDYIIKYNEEGKLDIEPLSFNKETKRFNFPPGIRYLMSEGKTHVGSDIINAFKISEKRDPKLNDETVYNFGNVFIKNYNHILPNVMYKCDDKDESSIIRLDTECPIDINDSKEIWKMYSKIPFFGTIWDKKRSLCGSEIKYLISNIAKNSPDENEREIFSCLFSKYCESKYPLGYNTRYFIMCDDTTYRIKRDTSLSPRSGERSGE